MGSKTRNGRGPLSAAIVAAVVLTAVVTPMAVASAARSQPVTNASVVGRGSKLSPHLRTLAQPAVQSYSAPEQSHAVGLADTGPGSLMHRPGGRIVVRIRFTDTSTATLDAVRAAGLANLSLSAPDLAANGVIAPADLAALVAVPGVASVVEELTPIVGSPGSSVAVATQAAAQAVTNVVPPCPTGLVSEGDAQLRADQARTNFSVNGAGVKVGILSDSFNNLGGAATDVAGAELPGAANTCGFTTPVQVQAEGSGGADEGRAMAQIVHDLAPGSPLAFASAFNGVVDFANQIRALQAGGASVIVDDISYFNEPMFQDGIIAKAVDDVVAAGATYYSSAGNNTLSIGGHEATSYESGAYRPTPCPAAVISDEADPNLTCHNFNQGGSPDNGDTMTIAGNQTVTFALSYSQPQGAVTTDLDLYVVDASTGSILNASLTINTTTEDPSEVLQFHNPTGSPLAVRLVVPRYRVAGGDAGTPRFKLAFFPNGAPSVTSVQYNVTTGNDIVGPSVFGHNGATRAATVAAVPFNSTAPFDPESYSSHGPLKKCWGPSAGSYNDGTRTYTGSPGAIITPCQTKTVDFAATDGGQNSFFGGGSPNRFYGTSAAAPHAAAVGALARQKFPCRTPDEILAAQRSSARPMAYSADIVGSGMIDANRTLQSLLTCAAPTVPGPPTNVSVSGVGSTSVTVSWAAPVSNGGSPITSYTVTASPGGQTCIWSTGPLTCIVPGLAPAIPYTFTVFAHNAVGDGPSSYASSPVTLTTPTLFNAVTPLRVADSRPTSQVGAFATPWVGGTIRDVAVGGVGTIPPDAVAVVLNVTVTDTTGSSFLTLWPAGQAKPTASSLNWTPGRTIPNAVTVKLGTGVLNAGKVSVFNLAGNVNVIIDVAGFYKAVVGDGFTSQAPTRLVDSRPGSQVGAFATPWTSGTSRDVPVAAAGVPVGADAVVLNVTVTDTTDSSFLTLWPTGEGKPTASNLNWTAGLTIPNAVTVKLGVGGLNAGKVSVFNLSGNVNVIIDVAGYYRAGTGNAFHPVDPGRVLDSRPDSQVGVYSTPWGSSLTRAVAIGNLSEVPPNADSVVLNTTVTNTTGSSYLTVWPAGIPQPTASSLNWSPGVTIPNAVTVKLGTGGSNAGKVSVFNFSGSADVITDVAGWFG